MEHTAEVFPPPSPSQSRAHEPVKHGVSTITVLDFGGQYAHLITNRIRRLGVYSELLPADTPASQLPPSCGIILSGGGQSVYENKLHADPQIFTLGIPVLGICYGHQWMNHHFGGRVETAKTKEYGPVTLKVTSKDSVLFKGLDAELNVYMSHGDEVTEAAPSFRNIASTDVCALAALEDPARKLFSVQFHPEVTHTPKGMDILRNFLSVCDVAHPWSVQNFADLISSDIKRDVRDRKVFILCSGGVDSTVAFTLLNKVLGKERVCGLLVDHGLMRLDECKVIDKALRDIGLDNMILEDASELFLGKLKNVFDPEEKRKIIGQCFLDVKDRVCERLNFGSDEWVLGQGTIYPDTIETGGTKHASKIKTHHNRIDVISQMIAEGRVVEPLKDLYKDEVRLLGELLELPHALVMRHPFPGPGLGVRILCAEKAVVLEGGEALETEVAQRLPGSIFRVLPVKSVGVQGDNRTYQHALAAFTDSQFEVSPDMWAVARTVPNEYAPINRVLLCTSHSRGDVAAIPRESLFTFTPSYVTQERADLLRTADAIVGEEMLKHGEYDKIWQFPFALLPLGKSAGGQSVVLRPVESTEAMTAGAYPLPSAMLRDITTRLTQAGIDFVFYDLTSKPPGTIEWE